VEKCGRVREDIDDNIIRRMRFTCRITQATNTHSYYVMLIAFSRNVSFTKAPQSYVIRSVTFFFLMNERITEVMFWGISIT
jgi:hypothetical protein